MITFLTSRKLLLTRNLSRGDFAKHPSAQAGYDYTGAFKDLVSVDLDIQVKISLAAVAQKTWAPSSSKFFCLLPFALSSLVGRPYED